MQDLVFLVSQFDFYFNAIGLWTLILDSSLLMQTYAIHLFFCKTTKNILQSLILNSMLYVMPVSASNHMSRQTVSTITRVTSRGTSSQIIHASGLMHLPGRGRSCSRVSCPPGIRNPAQPRHAGCECCSLCNVKLSSD